MRFRVTYQRTQMDRQEHPSGRPLRNNGKTARTAAKGTRRSPQRRSRLHENRLPNQCRKKRPFRQQILRKPKHLSHNLTLLRHQKQQARPSPLFAMLLLPLPLSPQHKLQHHCQQQRPLYLPHPRHKCQSQRKRQSHLRQPLRLLERLKLHLAQHAHHRHRQPHRVCRQIPNLNNIPSPIRHLLRRPPHLKAQGLRPSALAVAHNRRTRMVHHNEMTQGLHRQHLPVWQEHRVRLLTVL